MKDFLIDIMIDKGPGARSVQLNIEPFTLFGATTRLGNLTSPLRDRFGVVLRVDYYSDEDLFHIVQRSAGILEIEIDDDGTWEIARRSRGTPRIANRILRRTRASAEAKASGQRNNDIAKKSCTTIGSEYVFLMEFFFMFTNIIRLIIDSYNLIKLREIIKCL